jgi:hypothetical protein
MHQHWFVITGSNKIEAETFILTLPTGAIPTCVHYTNRTNRNCLITDKERMLVAKMVYTDGTGRGQCRIAGFGI